jgi:hypothetical protein
MDAGAVGPWSFGTACELLFGELGTCRGRRPRSALAPISATTSAAPYDHRTGRSRRCLCQRRLATCGSAIKCRPQAAGGHCSKLGRQIAVDLKADAHFDKCRRTHVARAYPPPGRPYPSLPAFVRKVTAAIARVLQHIRGQSGHRQISFTCDVTMFSFSAPKLDFLI